MKRIVLISAVALGAALFFLGSIGAPPASAQKYVMRRFRQPKDIPPALQNSLHDKVSEDGGALPRQRGREKRTGKPYTDFVPKFEYLPNYGPGGELSTISVKLGGAEYNPGSKVTTKGAATGKLNYLVFSYSRQGSKFVPLGKPKWESQDLGKQAGAEMTKHQQVGESQQGDYRQAAAEKEIARRRAAEKIRQLAARLISSGAAASKSAPSAFHRTRHKGFGSHRE